VRTQVERVDSNGLTLFFARGMPVRDVAAVTRDFLNSVGQYHDTGAFVATVDAAQALAAAAAAAGATGSSRRRGARAAAVHDTGNGYVRPGSIVLNVKTLTGKTFSVTVPGEGTVAHIKLTIYECEAVPPDQQRLICDGKQLDQYSFLEEAGVSNGAVLHMVLRLSGC
jgi:hypothetical protein